MRNSLWCRTKHSKNNAIFIIMFNNEIYLNYLLISFVWKLVLEDKKWCFHFFSDGDLHKQTQVCLAVICRHSGPLYSLQKSVNCSANVKKNVVKWISSEVFFLIWNWIPCWRLHRLFFETHNQEVVLEGEMNEKYKEEEKNILSRQFKSK